MERMEVVKNENAAPIFIVQARRAFACGAIAALFVIGAGNGLAQKAATRSAQTGSAADASQRLKMAVNEGAAANTDYTDIAYRYEGFVQVVEKALGKPVVIVPARGRDKLKENLKNHELDLLISRPNDVPAQAVRDFGYQPIASAKEPYKTLFIVLKTSPLKAIADVKGRSIVTPDQYSNMWRAARAMLRDAGIDMTKQEVKAMRDQAAIGWSIENGFYDVGVVNSASGVGRTWEKNGGRVIAASPAQINLPFIASPALPPEKVARLRAAVLALDSSDAGRAILRNIGAGSGFRDTPREEYVAFLKWLGEELKPSL
jgi:ABC-type phosphate/phosphonate transport system substrate-binding protein